MHGLFRVRGFTQDDAHIFCLPNQVGGRRRGREREGGAETAREREGRRGGRARESVLRAQSAEG